MNESNDVAKAAPEYEIARARLCSDAECPCPDCACGQKRLIRLGSAVQQWQQRFPVSTRSVHTSRSGDEGGSSFAIVDTGVHVHPTVNPLTVSPQSLGVNEQEQQQQSSVESRLESRSLTGIQEWASRMEGVDYYHHDTDPEHEQEYFYHHHHHRDRQEEGRRQRWARRQSLSQQGIDRDGNSKRRCNGASSMGS